MGGVVAPQTIETDASPEELAALLKVVERVWANYATSDPYYSVWTDEKFRGVPSAEALELFYSSGEHQVVSAEQTIERYGGELRRIKTVLEFGCGLGRVSCSLARHFPKVIGVDISKGHLDIASRYMAENGIANFTPVHLSRINDLARLPRFDLLYSTIVFQHNPPPIIRLLLDALFARLHYGGFALFQLPTSCPGYSFSVKRHLEQQAGIQDMEMHAFPLSEVHRLAAQHGCSVLEETTNDDMAAGWRSHMFVIRKVRRWRFWR